MLRRLLAGLAAVAIVGTTVQAQAIIGNGTIGLGVDALGQLNINGPSSAYPAAGFQNYGLRYLPYNTEATADGCPCEGWGAAYDGATSGYANNAYGTSGISFVSFTSTATTATTVGMIGGLEITQAYSPAPGTPNLYQVVVTLRNTTGATMNNVSYRRTMDWDIEPTPFNEFVELKGWGAAALVGMSDNGFQTGDPLGGDSMQGCAGGSVNTDYAMLSNCDHGASFNFDFGSLTAGSSYTLAIFYGANRTQSLVHADLALVGATVYSTAWSGMFSPDDDCPAVGGPCNNVFAFGFAGVNGTEFSPVPEPATFALMGTGLLGLVAIRRRRA